MADFYTNSREERVIDKVITNFGFEENEFSKYKVIRMALAWALNAKKIPLKSPQWDEKRLIGQKGKEYHLAQITDKGKDKDDFDLLLRALFYIKHKEELNRDKINIFENQKEYLDILEKYIKRGFYEIDNTHKSRDCIYQWCLDNLNLSILPSQDFFAQENSQEGYFPKLKEHFKKEGIDIKDIDEFSSYRHYICRVEIVDSTKIQAFKNKSKYLDNVLGSDAVIMESISGIERSFSIQIAKNKNEWDILRLEEFKKGLAGLKNRDDKLGIYAGNDIEKIPFYFDLALTPHLFVAGTTGSGKTVLLKNIILCLLRNQSVEISIIDPKISSFMEFENVKNINILGTDKADEYIESLIEEMQSRYQRKAQGESFEKMAYKILIVDELNDLIMQDENCNASLARLAQKGRECRIHLILGSQRPDSKNFDGNLRSNIPSRIALKVQKLSESKIILDESGADKLLGSGDMLIKLNDMPSPKHILAPYVESDEINALLKG